MFSHPHPLRLSVNGLLPICALLSLLSTIFGMPLSLNRNDDTVNAVFVGGRAVFLDGEATDLLGKRRTGRFLRAAHKAPAPTALEAELASVG